MAFLLAEETFDQREVIDRVGGAIDLGGKVFHRRCNLTAKRSGDRSLRIPIDQLAA